MTVIAGLIRFDDQPLDPRSLTAAANRLAAPGTGDARFWGEGGAALLVRQRISTPEDRFERQPWVGGGGRFVLAYDGRLDNRDEIIRALGLRIDPTEIVADGALVMAGFERWGEGALKRFLGDFALALWDVADRRLLLSRDHFGQRTLFTHCGDGFFAFASTLPGLLALPGVPCQLNEEKLADFLVLNFHFVEDTLYQGLRRLPPATAVTVTAQGVRHEPYWTLDPHRKVRFARDDDYVEAMREHLDRAVAPRLRSDGLLSASMSGGLDSSAVAATAARLMAPDRLLTLTAVPAPGFSLPATPDGLHADETVYVEAIAGLYPNMDLRRTWSDKPDALELDPTAMFAAGGLPVFGPTNYGWFAPLTKAALQAGSSVMLGGQAGNAAWSWNGLGALLEMFKQGRWLRLMRELDAGATPHRNRTQLFRQQVVRPLIPPCLHRLNLKWRHGNPNTWQRYSGINPQFAEDIGLSRRDIKASQGPAMGDNRPQWQTRLDRLTSHTSTDGMALMRALHGIEDRDPLTDLRLVEFCLSVPADQFLRGGVTRSLTRRALADRLPAAVINNNRIGQQNPEWFVRLSIQRPQMLDTLAQLQRSPLASRCLDLQRVSALLNHWPQQSAASSALHYLLPRTLHIGQFLMWLENGHASSSAGA